MVFVSYQIDRALKRLGADLKAARRRRRIKTQTMAERLGITRVTLARLEDGIPTVGMGVYAAAIHALDADKLKVLENLFADDRLGQALVDQALPKRIRGGAKT
ncbi:MAG: helix-turn-helix domain-containing protein [Betaproteobacteria bacterium]|nr:helix-turn-helix domain-containing protein [Betaproteobacteria bacterium]